MVSFDHNYLTSYLMTIVMFALYLNVYKIFAYHDNFKNFYLKNESQGHGVEERDFHHSAELKIFESI